MNILFLSSVGDVFTGVVGILLFVVGLVMVVLVFLLPYYVFSINKAVKLSNEFEDYLAKQAENHVKLLEAVHSELVATRSNIQNLEAYAKAEFERSQNNGEV